MGVKPSYTYIAITWMRELLLLQVPPPFALVGELRFGVIDLRKMMMVVLVVVVIMMG